MNPYKAPTAEGDPALPSLAPRADLIQAGRGFRNLILVFCGVLIVFWVPMLFMVSPGDRIRPIQAPLSMLMVAFAILRGLYLGIKQIVSLKEKRQWIQTLSLAPVPLCLYAGIEWFLHFVMDITYPP